MKVSIRFSYSPKTSVLKTVFSSVNLLNYHYVLYTLEKRRNIHSGILCFMENIMEIGVLNLKKKKGCLGHLFN